MTICPRCPKVKPFYSRLDCYACCLRCLCFSLGSGDDLDLVLTSDFGRSVLVGVEEVWKVLFRFGWWNGNLCTLWVYSAIVDMVWYYGIPWLDMCIVPQYLARHVSSNFSWAGHSAENFKYFIKIIPLKFSVCTYQGSNIFLMFSTVENFQN